MKRRLIEIRNEAARTGTDPGLLTSINRLIWEIEAEQRQTNGKIAKYEDYRKNGGQKDDQYNDKTNRQYRS